jgi:hypothetical protein
MNYIPWTSVAFAGIAALLWGASAFVNLPQLSDTFADILNLAPFHSAMKKVSKLNAAAAACAFVSALLQAITLAPH